MEFNNLWERQTIEDEKMAVIKKDWTEGKVPDLPYVIIDQENLKTHIENKLKDIDGNKYSKKENITPETTITANTNSGLYYFNQYAPVITTILSLVASTLSILAVTGVFK